MSLTFKLLSLVIRTAAKPIGNYIKRQAKEHDGFRRFAVAQAQRVHRIDMRMRLGILHDPEAQQRMHDRQKKAADEKKRQQETPTVRTEEEQKKYDEQKAKDEADGKKEEEKPQKVKIRPLSEARAIELGANFFSEAFIFAVAVGILLAETWRSRKKESSQRNDVAERLEQLETEVESLRAKLDPDLETLHDLSERIKAAKKARQSASWYNPLTWGRRDAEDTAIMEEEHDIGKQTKDEEAIVPIRKAKAIAEQGAGSEKEKKAKEAMVEQAREAEKGSQEKTKGDAKPPTRVDSVTASTKER
ncbi:hypothetical protein M409DRAFT_56856 [Zasmidium cellare ATCC 36951]|uniref:OPA3-like protein n=1 Tax=Zasmidium cellare ATCC 36951 TaxID=1080233 RepID=A0A6A6CD67_ZASCE|nr:uncharacterized protein M409DRAFT_56856 [Zasmidium cellare ATCC 36951]KAF2164150.1 hypothetical protein M409DRAFT_56856 [Zasmidium cellare ATCC 36951]